MITRRSAPDSRPLAARATAGTALALFLAAGSHAAAAPLLTGTDPPQLATGVAPGCPTLVLFGKGLVAPGTTFRSLPDDVKLSFDDGSGWRPGRLVVPGRGWGDGELTATLPPTAAPAGGLKVKVAVKGVESAAYTIPAFAPRPPGPPRIVSVAPLATAVGASPHHFVLEVIGDGHGGRLLFNGATPEGCLLRRESRTRDVYRFPVPEEIRDKPGRYSIHLENALGKSDVLAWDLVTRPELTDVAPASIRIAAAAAGPARPVSVMATFSGSQPKLVLYRVDDSPFWEHAASAIVFGNQVTFPLDLALLRPRSRVEVKLANVAGHSWRSIPVVRVEPAHPER